MDYPDMPAFTTASGQRVHFQQVTVRETTLGYLEGRDIYAHIRKRMSETVATQFGTGVGSVVRWPDSDALPAFTWFVELCCFEPWGDDDFSQLVVVQFADSLPHDMRAELDALISTIDWRASATGGSF